MASSSEEQARAARAGPRWRLLFVVALGLALAASALLLVPSLPGLFPRSVRRPLIEQFLQALLVAYAVALCASIAGLLLFGAWIACSRQRGRRRTPVAARLALLCGATVFGLLLLEASALAWRAWVHRVPALDKPRTARAPTTRRPVWAPVVPDGPPALREQFRDASPVDPLSLVVIGESSAQGYPFNPKLSIGQVVAWQLERALPGRQLELNVLAKSGATLEAMHHRLATLERRPDALIIYSGNNEFQSRYEWSRTVEPAPAAGAAGWLDRVEICSPLCALIHEQIDRNRLDAPPPLRTRALVDRALCTRQEYDAILTDFHRRLEAIVAYCEQVGALAILVIPPANDRDFEPSRSVLPETAAPREREAVSRAMQDARAAENDPTPTRAIDLYQDLLARYPGFAEAHYRLARLLEERGDWSAADRHYVLARDADGLPLRFTTPFQQAYRDVAAHHDCVLVDGPAVLRTLSPHGLLGDNLFHDAHHPALRGHIALAEAVLAALRTRGAFGWNAGSAPVIDPSACARHFDIGRAEWFTACERSSEFYRYTAIARYDPFARMAKARRFSRAGQLIQQGTPPEETGIPGLGCEPRPARGSHEPADIPQPSETPASQPAGRTGGPGS